MAYTDLAAINGKQAIRRAHCFVQSPNAGARSRTCLSIHVRPPEVDGQLFPGLWEGNLIKEMANAGVLGTLVERFLGLLILVRLPYFKRASAASLLQQGDEPSPFQPQFNLETAVGRVRLGREAVRWQG